jgi:DNA-directed RNA polymerase subunit omega
MTYPSSDRLEEQVESRYTLVVLAAKRAKQLREGAPKLIETRSTNPLTIALEEIAAGKVISRVPNHDDIPARGFETELEALPEVESAAEEAAELVAAPVDEAARVAELLKLPGTEDEADEEQPEVVLDEETVAEAEPESAIEDEVAPEEENITLPQAEEEPIPEPQEEPATKEE